MLELLKGNFEEDENGIGLSLGLSFGGSCNNKKKMDCSSDDKMLVERQRSQKRAMMENEELISKQIVRRKGENGTFDNEYCTYDEGVKNLNLSLNLAVPIWAQQNDGKRELMKKNVIRGGFRLYNENRGGNNIMSFNQCGSSESEENLSGKSSFNNYKTLSNGSTERCSSTISECQSSPPKGRSSSDNVMPIKEEQGQTEEKKRKFSSLLKQQSQESEIKNCGMIQLLSRMPCVSATGSGPNGKTINGLLCKYNSKTEINIVCVCHGKAFTPSEFVEHAGGTDVSQPLRHITVIPPCI